MPDPDRIHRVARLRPDEIEYLEREAGNRVSDPCCPHLHVFHHQHDGDDGGWWRTCQIWGCGCMEESSPTVAERYRARVNTDRELTRAERRGSFNNGVVAGIALVGVVVGALHLFGVL